MSLILPLLAGKWLVWGEGRQQDCRGRCLQREGIKKALMDVTICRLVYRGLMRHNHKWTPTVVQGIGYLQQLRLIAQPVVIYL
jgi:hypothetical protein